MKQPNVSHSVIIRVELSNTPGSLGKLTTAIGEAGGNILGIDLIEAEANKIVRDITVLAADPDHAQHIREQAEAVAGIHVRSVLDRTLRLHLGGKIEVHGKAPLKDRDDLSMAYTPGVARVSMEIAERPASVHTYTIKANSVAIVSDGSAVLGLGNIGPYAAIPVMEGKAQLFKEFANIDAFPICLNLNKPADIIAAVEAMEPVFGGINLEDIAAPACFEIEEALKSKLDIPVFHDDQHGTAVVVLAALRNAARVVDRKLANMTAVIAGAGAAGVACAKILSNAGVGRILVSDRKGLIFSGREDFDGAKLWLAENTNQDRKMGDTSTALAGADVFVGVSGPGIVTPSDIATMNTDPIVFALANPTPEVMPDEIQDIAAVIATGRSDYPNQINNVLCFPGIFRGSLDARAMTITEGMKLAAADAISAAVSDDELSPSYIVPSVFNKAVAVAVAEAVAQQAQAEGVVRHKI